MERGGVAGMSPVSYPKQQMASLKLILYVHLFNSCTQNWYAVASIIEDILENVKTKYPNIDTAYLKSDNAGCYHNSQLLLSLPEIGKRTGITVARYDFSEPNQAKTFAIGKLHI